MVQWLELQAPNAGGPGSIPVQGTGSHMLQLRTHMSQLKIPRATAEKKDTKIHMPQWKSKTLCAATKAQHAQWIWLCLTLCDPLKCSSPGSSVPGIFQARILEWVAMSSSWGSSWPRDWTQVSHTVVLSQASSFVGLGDRVQVSETECVQVDAVKLTL